MLGVVAGFVSWAFSRSTVERNLPPAEFHAGIWPASAPPVDLSIFGPCPLRCGIDPSSRWPGFPIRRPWRQQAPTIRKARSLARHSAWEWSHQAFAKSKPKLGCMWLALWSDLQTVIDWTLFRTVMTSSLFSSPEPVMWMEVSTPEHAGSFWVEAPCPNTWAMIFVHSSSVPW